MGNVAEDYRGTFAYEGPGDGEPNAARGAGN
jgi:hypothetical protein